MSNKNKITLETRETKLEKIKKKGLRKTLFTTVMSMGVLLGCTGMLVGCGEAGPQGEVGPQGPQGAQGIQGETGAAGADGATWFTGTAVTGNGSNINATVTNAKVGDLYFNTTTCDIYVCLSENTWNWISNIKGEDGENGDTGATGPAGPQGEQGEAGSKWLTGTTITGTTSGISVEITNAKVGDLYFNTATCDLYQCVAENTWNWLSNLKGEQGIQGEQGEAGDSVWFGYDGYYWIGAEKTNVSYKTLDDAVAENTIELKDSKYFEEVEIDLTNKQVALMGNLYETIQKSKYSESVISEISFYATKDGVLEIGTASIEDIIAARTNGTTLTTNVSEYEVKQGLNTIKLELEIGENETVVFGGTKTTVGMFATNGVNADDEYGYYSLIDGNANTDLLVNVNDVNSKLICSVSCLTTKTVYTAVFDDMQTKFPFGGTASLKAISGGPFKYVEADIENAPLFAGKTITRIDVPVVSVSNLVNPYFTVYTEEYNEGNPSTSTRVTYQVSIPVDEIESAVDSDADGKYEVNKWIKITGLNIPVPEGHTLAFVISTDTAQIAFTSGDSQGNFPFHMTSGSQINGYALLFDCYTSENVELEDIITQLETEESDAQLKNVLTGKTLSVLGDSISTNTILGATKTEGVWWRQSMDKYSMTLAKNNSISGTMVTGENVEGSEAGWYSRCEDLADDSGNAPDVIAVFMGTNDYDHDKACGETIDYDAIEEEGFVPTNFTDSYALMIYKMTQKYPDAKIFCLTVPDNCLHENNALIVQYDMFIKQIAEHYGCEVVEVYQDAGINDEVSYYSDNLHPNEAGMDKITECFDNALKNYYLK